MTYMFILKCALKLVEEIILASICFEQAYCSSSGGKTLYIHQLVYVMRLC